jgi:hypothetical protein
MPSDHRNAPGLRTTARCALGSLCGGPRRVCGLLRGVTMKIHIEQLPVVDGVSFARIPCAVNCAAGSDGSIWSSYPEGAHRGPRWRMMTQYVAKDGYMRVGILLDTGKRKTCNAHRLVLSAFTGEERAGLDAAHNDGNKTNNVITNLRWATRKENFADRRSHGTWPINEHATAAKLTAEDVATIKARIASGESNGPIAKCFFVTKENISAIRRGRIWNHG